MVKIDACKDPMFEFDIDWDEHFRACKDIDVFGFISPSYVSVHYIVPEEWCSEKGFPLTVNFVLISFALSCDRVIRDAPCSVAPVSAPPSDDCIMQPFSGLQGKDGFHSWGVLIAYYDIGFICVSDWLDPSGFASGFSRRQVFATSTGLVVAVFDSLLANSASVTGLVVAIFDNLLATSANVESVGVGSVYVGVSSCSSVLKSSSANLSIVCLPVTSGSTMAMVSLPYPASPV